MLNDEKGSDTTYKYHERSLLKAEAATGAL